MKKGLEAATEISVIEDTQCPCIATRFVLTSLLQPKGQTPTPKPGVFVKHYAPAGVVTGQSFKVKVTRWLLFTPSESVWSKESMYTNMNTAGLPGIDRKYETRLMFTDGQTETQTHHRLHESSAFHQTIKVVSFFLL